jgi:hypothetical protein
MNRNAWSNPQTRVGCAAAAAFASALVLSSVLWLFASASAPVAAVPTSVVQQHPASPWLDARRAG